MTETNTNKPLTNMTMYEYEVYLSNPTMTVSVWLSTEEPTEFELIEAALEEIENGLKLDSYKLKNKS